MAKLITEVDFFKALPSYRKMNDGSPDGRMTYLRIGKGLFTGKAWADYVDDSGHRWMLKNKFYPTLLDALKALYNEVQKSIPKK